VEKTQNPYILRIVENSNLLSGEDFFKKLKELESVALHFDEEKIKLLLKDIIPEYKTIN
jgi:hypothetical protein